MQNLDEETERRLDFMKWKILRKSHDLQIYVYYKWILFISVDS